MSKLNRFLAVGLVLAAAACGDDVTVVQPPPPPEPGIRSVTVAPNPANIAIGEQVQMSAAVVTDPGAPAVTVAWTSASPGIASVGATTGLVTGVAQGSAAITATATAGTSSAQGVATVNVAAITEATVSINSVTTAGGAPVLLAAVAGQINVIVNLDRGTSNVQRVDVLLGDKVVGSQVFSAAVMVEPVDVDLADQVELISFPVNTASFDATTGEPDHFNGPTSLSARVVTATAQEGIASPSLELTLANVNTFVAEATLTGGFDPAISAAGLQWRRGGLAVSVLPVVYTPGVMMAAGAVTFGSLASAADALAGGFAAGTACDASGIGRRTLALAAPAEGEFKWTATLSNTAAAGAGNVTNYELAAAGCPATTLAGENVAVTATGTDGNPVLLAALPVTALGLRLDNRPPGAPTFVANPNLRQNQWINATVALNGANTGVTSNGWLVNGAADAGVGGYVRQIRTGLGPTAAAARVAEPSTDLPDPSLTNSTYCALASATDLLGNESALPAAGTVCTFGPILASSTPVIAQHLAFGVDIAPPTIAFSGGLAANAQLNGGTVGAEFQVTVSDTGTVGNSGMLSTSAVRGTVQIRSAALTPPSAGSCFIGTFAGGACNPVSVNAAPPFPLVPTTTVAAAGATGYYTYVAFSQDAAGNQSDPVTRVIAYDPAANVPALTTALFNVPLTGPTVVFNANASDNFDLQNVTYSMTYAGGLVGPIVFPAVVLNDFNQPPLVNSNVAAGITVEGFMRQVENVTGNAPLTVGGQFKPINLAGVAQDMALNLSAVANTAIPGASVTNGVSYTAAVATQLIDSWAITGPGVATNVSNGAGPAAPVNPLSVTFNVDAFGPTANFNPPFTRVDFYRVVAGNLVQIGSTTTVSTIDDGTAQGRRHRYVFTWTPGPTVAAGAQTIYAIGVNGVGDALVTPADGNITITNP